MYPFLTNGVINLGQYFKELEILKLTDLVTLHNALPMYHYHHNILPSSHLILKCNITVKNVSMVVHRLQNFVL